MRILYHHRTRGSDAQGVHIAEIVRAFRELGHDVRVVALAERRSGAPGASAGGSRLLHAIPAWCYELLSLGYNLYGYRLLCRERRSFKPDLVYERYSLNTFCGVWAARRLHVPHVLEVNAPLAQEQEDLHRLAFRRLARFSERWICSHSTCTIVVTGVMKDMLASEGVPPEHVFVIRNGIDPANFHPGVSGAEIRRKHGLDGKLSIGFVGWFREWHGVRMLLEVARHGRIGDLGARILLVGDGPAAPDLRRFVRENGMEDQVVFTGPVRHDEVPAHIAAMDVAVVPRAPTYACPLKIIEYMALGKCVVAPDQANIREILQHRKHGVLFKAGDPAALEAALIEVIRDREARERIGKAAHQAVLSRRYLWKANAEQALALAGVARRDAAPSPRVPSTPVLPLARDPVATTVLGVSEAGDETPDWSSPSHEGLRNR